MTMVIRTDGSKELFNKTRIIDAILTETKLCEELFGTASANLEDAEYIADLTEEHVTNLYHPSVSSHMIRELMCAVMLDEGKFNWYRVCTRVGMPVYDSWQIDHGTGFESHDNANLKANAETSHKKKADKLSKEENLLLLPPKLARLHQCGDFRLFIY